MYVLNDGVYGLASEVLLDDKKTTGASGSGAPTAPVGEFVFIDKKSGESGGEKSSDMRP